MKRKYVALFSGATLFIVVFITKLGGLHPVWQAGTVLLYSIAILLALTLATVTISKLSEKRLAFARKEERKRIAADLHDEIGPRLALVKFQIDALQYPGLDIDSARINAMENLDELSQKLRDITRTLVADNHHSFLVDKVGDLVAKLTNATGIPIYFDYHVASLLNEQQNCDCYLVIQETLNNAVKHGGASEIFISIYEEHHRLNFTCRDNGEGFDYKTAIRQNRGMGLSNIAWRMRRLKGKYFVDSRPGSGSAFHYQISLG